MSSLQQDLIAILLLIGTVMFFGHEMIGGDKVPFFRDLGPYFYPIRLSLAQSYGAGELPLWDRHMGMGFPLLADFQSGAFYPPHLFYLALPFFTAVGATFLFHYLVAAIGSYLLCRQWSYPPYLAIVGAVLFSLGGAIVSLTNLMNHFQTAVWLPWVILLWEKTLRFRSLKNFLCLILVLTTQFLAGSPEIYVMTLFLLLINAMRINSEGQSITRPRAFWLLVATNVLVVGLAMVQVLPTIELFLQSRASRPVVFGENSLWSLHPLNVFNLFFLDKEVDTYMGSGVHIFFLRDTPFLVSHYMGVISLFGVCLWFYYGSRRERTVLLTLIIISLILAMGSYTPVYPLLFRYIPLFSLFRFPEKFFFLTYAILIFISLKGLACFIQSDATSSKVPFLIVLLVCLIPSLFYIFLRFDTAPLIRFIAWTTEIIPFSSSTLGRTSAVLVGLERQIVAAFGILLLLFLSKKGKLRPPLFRGLIVGLVIVDLISAHRPYQYLLAPDFINQGPRIIGAPDASPNRLFYYPGDSNLHPSYYRILRQPTFSEFQSISFSNLLPNTGVFHGFDYMQEIDALRRWPYIFFLDFANQIPREKLYRLLGTLNVKYINSFQPLAEGSLTLIQHFPEHPSWLYKLSRTVPRAYIVQRTVGEKHPREVLDRLSREDFDPLKEAILETPLPIPGEKNFKAQVDITNYSNSRVTMNASLNGTGLLVLADSFYPGWRVYVDGDENKILRANFFFRGVPLSVGEHTVEFRYQPRSYTIGLMISLITLCGVVIWILVLYALRRKERVTHHVP